MNITLSHVIAASARALIEASRHANRAPFTGRQNAQTNTLNAKRRWARRVIRLADANGLTLERPYTVHGRIVCTIVGDELVPAWGGAHLAGPLHRLPS